MCRGTELPSRLGGLPPGPQAIFLLGSVRGIAEPVPVNGIAHSTYILLV